MATMDLVSGIGGKVLELTLEPIGRQLGYIISYHSNVTRLKDELQELQNHRMDVQHRVDAARRQGEEILEVVQYWITKVDGITEDAHALYTKERHGNTGCSWKSFPNPWLRHRMSRQAKRLTMEIKEIKCKEFDSVSFFKPPELVGLPPTPENNEGIKSRILIMKQVLKALEDPHIGMVGLCGLPVVGKTTLANEIARKAMREKFFDMVVWVTVAQNPKLEEIQTQIAESVGMKLEVVSVNTRASHLLQRLEKEKRLLVVLDDLWERLDLHLVGIPPCGCRILLTSRNEELLSNQMNCKNNFTVGELYEEEAWKLFKDRAELDESNHTELLHVAKEVFQQCGRLPLALVSVATALKNKIEVRDWRDALRRLQTPLRRNLSAWDKEIGPSLKFSYDYLNNERQSIFLLSAMLSHDLLIKDLLMYVVGLNLLEGVHSIKQAQDALEVQISKLKSSNLLLDSFSDERVTMHDLFRDFAFEEEKARMVKLKGQDDFGNMTRLEGYTRLCLDKWDKKLPRELYCPKLEFFLLSGDKSDLIIPDKFFESLTEVKAMGFTNMNFSSLPSLGLSEKLQTLCLHSCRLEDISEVGIVKSLKVLSLAHSRIKRLPCELALLTSLQVLDLSRCRKLIVIPPKVLSSLTRLEVLDMEESFSQWEADGSSGENENASLDELKHLTNLYSLNIHIPKNSIVPKNLFKEIPLEKYMISFGHSFYLWSSSNCRRTLKFQKSVNLDDGMQKLFEKVEQLYFEDVSCLTNVLGDIRGRGFPQCLKHLEIINCKSVKAIVMPTTHKDLFHQLRTLKVANLPMLLAFSELEKINAKSKSLFNNKISFPKIERLDLAVLNSSIPSIWDDPLPQNSFSNLKTLSVEKCGFVGRLVPLYILKSLRNLEELIVSDCDLLEVVFDFEELDGYNEIHSSISWVVPLKTLKLSKLPKLKHLWSNGRHEMVSFPCFEEVEVFECERLTSMFPSSELQEEDEHEKNNHLFPHQKVVQNLKRFHLRGKQALMIWNGLFPDNCFSNVQRLSLSLYESENCLPPHGLHNNKFPNLQVLELSCWGKEPTFSRGKPPRDEDIEPFKPLELCPIEFLQNLQSLHVCSWQTLSLLTPSTSRGLLQLTLLRIADCDKMKEVVTKSQQPDEEDDVGEEIVFWKLKSVMLDDLPSLVSFCSYSYSFSFPSLEALYISRRCRRMSMFCQGDVHTPSLKVVSFEGKDEKLLDGNLNKTIQHHLLMEVTRLNLIPEMRSLWMGKLAHRKGYFSRLEHLIVDNCDFLSEYAIPTHLVTSFSNLQWLEVSNCRHLKSVFGPKALDMDEEEALLDGSECFRSLQELYVSDCERLEYVFVASIAKAFAQLWLLSVSSCTGVKVIIADDNDETSELESPNFGVFPRLCHLKLHKLNDLKCFCPQRCTFEWPQLERVHVSRCENLKVFGTEMTSFADSGEKYGSETQPPLFLAEKLVPKLKGLSLSRKDVALIENHQFQKDLFHEVDQLNLESFLEESATFPYRFLDRFPKLLKLGVKHSAFKEIFSSQAQKHTVSSSFKEFGLVMPTPTSSASFQKLTHLVVSGCHQLIYLLTDSTAKVLVNLQSLEVKKCKKMEEIVKSESEDAQGGITFNELRELKLDSLLSLEGFRLKNQTFKFPNLRTVTIKGCHKLKTFSLGVLETPELRNVHIEDTSMHLRDLNKTIELFFSEKRRITKI